MFDDYYDGYSAGYYHGSGAAAGVGIIGGIILIGGLLFILPVVAAIILFIVVEFLIIRACVENYGDHLFITIIGCLMVFFAFATPVLYYISLSDYRNSNIIYDAYGKPITIYSDENQYNKKTLKKYEIGYGFRFGFQFSDKNTHYNEHCLYTNVLINKYKKTNKLILYKYDEKKRIFVKISETYIDKSKSKPFHPLRFYLHDDKLIQLESNISIFKYRHLSMEELYKDVPFSRYYNKN